MLKLQQKITFMPLFISLVLSLFCSQVVSATNSTFERIKKDGVLLVGMSGEQPPFNFVSNLETVIGYDVDLTTALAKSVGAEVRIELMPFSELMEALEDRKIDIIISGFAFTEERSKEITFVGPYALSGKSLLITKKRLKEIKASTGFNHEKVHLMALENSTSKTLAENRLEKAKLTTIKHYEDALMALRSGEADALVADLAICELAVIRETAKELTTLQKPLAVEEIGLAIKKDEPLLEAHLSAQLRKLSKSGALKELHNKWFNSPGWLELLP
ncbi:substrate-binding periplasmic protein [Psychromonas sp. Urea-02u-13]|uniref:substrate-binding periplasmic protein n=1 Tax=Psychromonas sp. Urea-02u-13 TaxID=2058326 RepID=UPI0012FF0505|nr:transporter substrate-binding domain-containing protein [Psychromonas sp. Urea-02u-13]